MAVKLRWKTLRNRATDLSKRIARRTGKPSAEASTRSHLGARVADIEKRALGTILHPFKSVTDRAADAITERVANKLIDRGLVEVDQAATRAIQRTVAMVAIGLWGATTAAAISLALSVAVGGQPKEWLVYVLIVSGALGLWNVAVFLQYLRQFRHLEGDTQRRLMILVASKIGVRGVVIIAVPVAVLLALGTARLLL